MNQDTLELRELAEAVATETGELVARMRASEVEIAHTKSTTTDVVTRADLAAEELVATRLREARPRDGLLGEEGTQVPSESGITWVIDPIDGTVNYLYGRPEYAVSVAAVTGDPMEVATWQPLAGCVVAPALDLTYRAALGHGGQRNGVDLRLGEGPALEHALVGTGFSYSARVRQWQGPLIARLLPQVRDIRRAGAGSLDVCDVAAGRLDAHFELGLNPWDIAAAVLLVTEAGGTVRITPPNADGARLTMVASTGVVAPLIEAIGPIGQEWEQPRHSER